MRLAVGRRNRNDSDSSDIVLLQYINDFISLSMTDDVKIFQNFETLVFNIGDTNESGVYPFKDLGTFKKFSTISSEGFISRATPPGNEFSWNRLYIYFDPGIFFDKWGVNNDEVLVKGYPTEMLFYGPNLTFRTIPDQEYQVTLYAYSIYGDFLPDGDPEIPEDYLLRYLAYGSAFQYVSDYRYEQEDIARINLIFKKEKALVLSRVHDQIKVSRGKPRF